MSQVRLPLYSTHGPLTWDEVWTHEQEDMFVALLLECGPPPAFLSNDEITTTFFSLESAAYHRRLESALAKYYRPSCPLHLMLVANGAEDAFYTWLDSRKQQWHFKTHD